MIYSVIKENSYQDSINLMLLTNHINSLPNVEQCSIMMGTDANKDILKNTGMYHQDVDKAKPDDMVIVVKGEGEQLMEAVLMEVEDFLQDQSIKKKESGIQEVDNWEDALEALPDANLALISVPGIYAADEIENALDLGLHVFCFSDNVPLEEEVRLKAKAHEKGLLLMGPDSGTGILSNVPLAFTNVVRKGNIGIVGASGTGIQEVTTLIQKLGGGVTHAIGTGGRDLHGRVGAITMKDAILGLENHRETEVILVLSKPPAPEVRDQVVGLLHGLSKPVVALFLGESPSHHEGKIFFAHTLEEAAIAAFELSQGKALGDHYHREPKFQVDKPLYHRTIKGLYSGGTLANEAGMMMAEALGLEEEQSTEDGYILRSGGFEVLDLGDDTYTQGKPHPMMDPEIRIKMIRKFAQDPNTGVILLDIVLGYGSHGDMAGALAPAIRESLEQAEGEGRKLYFVGSLCGSREDPQDYEKALSTLQEAGVLLEESNAQAVRLALKLIGVESREQPRTFVEKVGEDLVSTSISEALEELLHAKPRVVNVGLEGFRDPIIAFGGKAIHFNWRPIAGGNKKLMRILKILNQDPNIDEQNERVIQLMEQAQPFLMDVVPAKSVIPELEGRVLLHAGPPIEYGDMTGPMQGSCIGAVLFEGWADNEEEARALLEGGGIRFMPCHHAHAVGPMGGITSGNMPVMVVKNKLDNTPAYCIMNEGIGKVLRFGAYSQEVVDRLIWMRDVLGPVLSKAFKLIPEGLNLHAIMGRAITMGDEFHQRNIAASLIFLKEMAPLITQLDVDRKDKKDVIQFLADTDQFFLNVMMAVGKATVDSARRIREGTVVTTMTRNGKDFGIRISGLGDRWFTAPVNKPDGLYFTGFSAEDANPDIGDSAIAETVGFGGMAMIAAPGVTRFVGAGGFDDALRVSNEMAKICITRNPNFSIPTWDFKGIPLGIDIRKVVATGITPIINTGIAHQKAGIGQVGAGTVRAPLECFEKALIAYGESLGIIDEESDHREEEI